MADQFGKSALRKSRNTWLFQANPAKYKIYDSLVLENEEYWNLNQHAEDVHAGDRVLIWVCGKAAGIYALGTVVEAPAWRSDSATGISYWTDKANGRRRVTRALVRYDCVMVDRPLSKEYLQADPALWNMRVLNQPLGTNFAIKQSEWEAMSDWLHAMVA